MRIKKRPFRLLLFGVLLSLAQSRFAQDTNRSRQLTQPETPAKQSTQLRLALVIGNSKYQNAPQLNNPTNDARDLSAALRSAGFDVIEKENQTADQIKTLIREFGDVLSKRRGVGLFYFAGHGVQIRGKNYLIPIEAKNLRENSIEFDAVDVGRVLTQMEDADNGLNLVILDACRSNPFTRSWRSTERGLAEINAPTGTLVAYATRPGMVADDGDTQNGLYTSELIKWIKEPGLNIEEMFKQVRKSVVARSGGQQIPAEYTMLTGDFVFTIRSASKGSDEPPKEPQRTTVTPLNVSAGIENLGLAELSNWESIKNSTSNSDYERHLKDYPHGLFAEVAQDRLQQLRVKSNPAAPSVIFRVRSSEKEGKVFLSYRVVAKPNSTLPQPNTNEFLSPLMRSLNDLNVSVAIDSVIVDRPQTQVQGVVQEIARTKCDCPLVAVRISFGHFNLHS